MAKKSLADQALMQGDMLLNLAGASKAFSDRMVKEDTNVEDMHTTEKKKLIYVNDEDLIDDPDNEEVYGESDVEGLARAMRDGFQGVILAYPHEGKYRIESGHRRRDAARLAGIKVYPIYPTEPPLSNFERIIRLHRANSHNRKYTPMVLARQAEQLFNAFREKIAAEKERDKNEETKDSAEKTYDANILTAQEMELSVKHIQKYRALMKLIPELQVMADSGDYSWSALSGASTLGEGEQQQLYGFIKDKAMSMGVESVNGAWISNSIKKLKSEGEKAKDELPVEEEERRGRRRRKNGTKVVVRAARELHEVLDEEALYKADEIPEVLEILEKLKESINCKMAELQDKSNTSW